MVIAGEGLRGLWKKKKLFVLLKRKFVRIVEEEKFAWLLLEKVCEDCRGKKLVLLVEKRTRQSIDDQSSSRKSLCGY